MCSPSIAKAAAVAVNPLAAIPALVGGDKKTQQAVGIRPNSVPDESIPQVAPSTLQVGKVEGMQEEAERVAAREENAIEPITPDYEAIRRNYTTTNKKVKKGRASTIATSPLGDTSAAPTQRKTLLGY